MADNKNFGNNEFETSSRAKDANKELSLDSLEKVNGGAGGWSWYCKKCDSMVREYYCEGFGALYYCPNCGEVFRDDIVAR